MIKAKGLQKIYQGHVPTIALQDISFRIKEGEFVAIMGKSGSGKSTLLHLLGLFDAPNKGQITYNNQDVLGLTERDKTMYRLHNLGYVFQEYALLPELNALESVYLPLKMRNFSKDEYIQQAESTLKKVGLEHRMHHLPQELSGGEQQRVAIARAIVGKPKILFADEPCANLDSESSGVILDLFRKLNKEFNQTIVMVTHEPDDEKVVDRVIRLKDGLIEDDLD